MKILTALIFLVLAAGASAQVLTTDTAATTPGGTAFTAPKDWRLESTGSLRLLSAPEGDARIAVADDITAPDAKAAATAAWALYKPDFKRTFKIAAPRAPRDGWEERSLVDYEISPNEKLTLYAFALRAKGKWTVALFDSSDATFDKRSAAMNLVSQSLRAPGYTRESFAGRTPHKLDAARIAALRDFLKTGMAELGVPGVGLALIQDGRIVHEGGIGIKRLGSPEPVDAHTLFMVASNTKGMSTLMLATLVDEGKFGWDSPVTQVYPAFRLGNDATTAQVRMRHLVCACTGLPRKDLEWIYNTPRDTKADNVFRHLAATQPTSGFGEVYQYNNLITTAGGFIGGKVAYPAMETGAAYDRAMAERVFGPLGMRDTTLSFNDAVRRNHASPHGFTVDGAVAVSSVDLAYSVVPYRPAGGAWSSAHDMAQYAMLELSRGVLPSGKRLVSEANLLERRKHGVPTGEDSWYGMGLVEDRKAGVPVVLHGGSMPGHMSNFFVLPDAGIAAVVLTNSDSGNMLLRPFMRRLLELTYDGKPEAATSVSTLAKAMRADQAEARKKLQLPPDPAATAALASSYESPELGHIAVVRTGGRVRFDFTDWSSDLATRKNDDGTLSFVTISPSIEGFPFVVGTKDGKRTLSMRDPQHEYIFTEIGR